MVLGDFGTGEKEQTQVSDAIAKQHTKTPFNFGITVGDNFYQKGLCGLQNERWKLHWHNKYDKLGISFYASLGNHDWDGLDESGNNYCAAETEIRYSDLKTNPTWRMPRTYYSYTAGAAQFFVLDTDKRSPQQPQRQWLAEGLKASTSRWKIVYGHHPIYSGGKNHGNSSWLKLHNDILQAKETEADLFIAGHDHDLQHLKEKQLHYLGVGGGGRQLFWDTTCLPQSLFAKKTYGFASIKANDTELEMTLISPDGKTLNSCTITKKVLPDGSVQRTDNCKRTCK